MQAATYLPTLEEIRKLCAEIRTGWDDMDWARAAGRTSPWRVPVIEERNCRVVRKAIEEEQDQ